MWLLLAASTSARGVWLRAGCPEQQGRYKNAQPLCAPPTALGGTRCCGGKSPAPACVSLCDATQWGTNSSCLRVQRQQAREACVALGRRLCTADELASCCKTGCAMDQRHVWTADTCASPAAEPDDECVVRDGCEARGVYNSAAGQELSVLSLLGGKRKGYFLDIASNHPTWLSNTRALERDQAWRGVCVEPNPALAQLLRAVRRCTVVEAAVMSQAGRVKLVNQHGQHHSFGEVHAPPRARRLRETITDVEALPIREVLRRGEAPRTIDYFSLDVEGFEAVVMEGFPFDAHNISLMTIERPKLRLVRQLEAHDLAYLCDHGRYGDQLWAHASVLERHPQLRARSAVHYREKAGGGAEAVAPPGTKPTQCAHVLSWPKACDAGSLGSTLGYE